MQQFGSTPRPPQTNLNPYRHVIQQMQVGCAEPINPRSSVDGDFAFPIEPCAHCPLSIDHTMYLSRTYCTSQRIVAAECAHYKRSGSYLGMHAPERLNSTSAILGSAARVGL